MSDAPVICIDGPTASGKGTIAMSVARALHWHYLDSGSLYRLVGLLALQQGLDREFDAETSAAIAALASSMAPRFDGGRIQLGRDDVTEAIRAENVGQMASRIAVLPDLRAALLERQRAFREWPGLVADGRDMGTVVFPDARIKVFLTASVESRAERRYKQLIEKGFSANLESLLAALQQRDDRDANRASAPLRSAVGAFVLDSTRLNIDQTVQAVLNEARRCGITGQRLG